MMVVSGLEEEDSESESESVEQHLTNIELPLTINLQ